MSDAIFTVATVYPDLTANSDFAEDFPDLEAPATVFVRPHPDTVLVPHDTQSAGEALVEDGGAEGDEIEIDFGAVVECTGFVLRNMSRQDLSVGINGVTDGTSEELDTAIEDLDAVVTAQSAILAAFDGEDDAGDIVAAIATALAALDAARDALVAANEGAEPIFTMPSGAVLTYAQPDDGADTPIESITLLKTGTQTDDGYVDFKIFGLAGD